MKTFALGTALGALALATAQPALAQDAHDEAAPEQIDPDAEMALDGDESAQDDEEMDAMAIALVGSIFATMFEAEPLTPEAEARLPAASSVAASLVPEGVYGEMMGQMMDSFLSPILELAEQDGGAMSAGDLAEYTGLDQQGIESLSQEERAELTQMFDPVYETRSRVQVDMIVGAANSVFATLEPGVRDGLAKAYATRFEASELDALNAFFATPAGAKYASQSLVINTDPQVISGMMQSIPSLLEQLPVLLESFEDAEAGLPEPRRYDDLTPAEQRRASTILGVDQPTLRESMVEAEAAAEMELQFDEAMEESEAEMQDETL